MVHFRHLSLAVFIAVLLMTASAPCAMAAWPPEGTAVCTATMDQEQHRTISDGAGGAIVAWRDGRNGNYDIYVQRLDASGNAMWTTDGVALCTDTGYQSDPAIAPDGAGGAIVTWHDNRSGGFDIYMQRVNASGTPQWTSGGLSLCTATANQLGPLMASDGSGGAIVSWYDYRNSNWDIYSQRVNGSGTPQWTANGVAICTATGDQDYPTTISDGAGGAIVTWEDPRGGATDIYAQRIDSSGTVQWMTDGVVLCEATASQYRPDIAADGTSGAIVTWFDSRSGNYSVYAQRINSTGAVQWTADGVAICANTYDQTGCVIVADGSGGGIIAWDDERTGALRDIFVQRINSSGTVQWTADGVALCTAVNDQSGPAIASDGAGGGIVAWTDSRSNDTRDVFAQRIDFSGTVQWTTDGVLVGPAAGNQELPSAVPAGAGGTIVAWRDERGGNADIYALRLTALGNIGSDPVPLSMATAVLLAGALLSLAVIALKRHCQVRLT